MTDAQVVAAAVLVALTCWWHPAVPWWIAAVVVLVAIVVRRPVVVIAATAALAAVLAARSFDGLRLARSESVQGVATVWADPVRRLGGVTAGVRLDGSHFGITASGTAAGVLASVEVGNRIEVVGRAVPFPSAAGWSTAAHLRGNIDAQEVRVVDAGVLPFRVANSIRHVLDAGLTSLSSDQHSLFDGIVIGDDRDQSQLMSFDFRASGLGHLLAVSGQNVAFVLVAASPLLSRIRLRWRWATTLGILGVFALVTRWEPSVLRAVMMSAVAVTVGLMGRHASPGRVVSLAIIGLLLADPLLVFSFGFQLSVAATVSLVIFARRIARRMPGPVWLAEPLGVVLAAHLGTAPLLLAVGQPMSAASIPANLVAVPVAGWVMVWGLTGGLVAGRAGAVVSGWIHLPTRLMLWLIDTVASLASRPSVPRLGWLGSMAIAASIGLMLVTPRRWRWIAGAPVALALAVAVVGLVTSHPQLTTRRVGAGSSVIADDATSVLVLSGRADERAVLDDVGAHGCPDLAIVTSGRSRPAGIVASVRTLCGPLVVAAADPTSVRDARPLAAGTIRVAHVRLEVRRQDDKWVVRSAADP